MTPRKKASKAVVEPVEPDIVDDELDDELDDEVDETPEPKAKKGNDELPERETYTAKQVATRIGTDAKTLRKFFRTDASTVEPVGQGGRYEFDAADLPKIREEFEKWNSGKTTRAPKDSGEKAPRKSRGRSAPAHADLIEEDDEILELDDDDELDDEPSDDELDDIEDELDDDELDDDETNN